VHIADQLRSPRCNVACPSDANDSRFSVANLSLTFKVIFQSKAKKLEYLKVVRDVAGYIDKVCKIENANVQPIQPIFDDIITVYKDFVF
jgi:hypothetical protein